MSGLNTEQKVSLSIYFKVVIARVLFIGRITCVAHGSCPLYESHARNHDLSLGPEKENGTWLERDWSLTSFE